MLLILLFLIYDQKHGHVLIILMGKLRIDGQELISTNAARYRLKTVLGFRIYAPIISGAHTRTESMLFFCSLHFKRIFHTANRYLEKNAAAIRIRAFLFCSSYVIQECHLSLGMRTISPIISPHLCTLWPHRIRCDEGKQHHELQ